MTLKALISFVRGRKSCAEKDGIFLPALNVATINQRLTSLIGFYRWAKDRGLIDEVPWDAELRPAPE